MAEPRGFSFPFRADKDGFPQPAVGIDRVGSQIRQVLLTERGERLRRPLFGSRIREHLFENIDAITLEVIKAEVMTALLNSDVDALITDIQVTADASAASGGDTVVAVEVMFDQRGRRGSVNLRFSQSGVSS